MGLCALTYRGIWIEPHNWVVQFCVHPFSIRGIYLSTIAQVTLLELRPCAYMDHSLY